MKPTFFDQCRQFGAECLMAASSGWAGGIAFMVLMALVASTLFVS